jgi:hypothetical protein
MQLSDDLSKSDTPPTPTCEHCHPDPDTARLAADRVGFVLMRDGAELIAWRRHRRDAPPLDGAANGVQVEHPVVGRVGIQRE